jgi:hypothetical protein
MPREDKAGQEDEDEDEDEDEEERNDPSLRSLMMGMMKQMHEMRLENARLHSTIADLCARQAHTESKLAALEKEGQDRMHEAVTHPVTLSASAPTELGMMTTHINNKRYHNEVKEFIRHNLPYLAGYDLSALAIKDLTYALCCTCKLLLLSHTLTVRCAFVWWCVQQDTMDGVSPPRGPKSRRIRSMPTHIQFLYNERRLVRSRSRNTAHAHTRTQSKLTAIVASTHGMRSLHADTIHHRRNGASP